MVFDPTHSTHEIPFPAPLMQAGRERFAQIESDHRGRRRFYFENAGGSFRLKAALAR